MNIFNGKFKSAFGTLTQLAAGIIIMIIPITTYSQTNYDNPNTVPLLTAGTYGVLASTGIAGTSNVTGNIGTVTGSISETVVTTTGTKYDIGSAHTSQAQTDLAAALANAVGRANNATILNELGGKTLQRGVYEGGALNLASGTTFTLDGSATDIFIIKSASSLIINTSSVISLINGAVWSNVFWYVGSSSTQFSGSTFQGIILAVTSITVNAGTTLLNGRLLANTGAVTINSNVLPVELTSFTAVLKNNSVELNWNTATEVNNYGFNVERRILSAGNQIDNSEWKIIGFVQGNGNSNSDKAYSFEDNKLHAGKLEYRLKQIDFDGTFEYSNIVEIQFDSPVNLALNQNYPNPFNPSTNIEYSIPNSGIAILKIYDALGREISTLVNEMKQPGTYQVAFDGSKIPSGVYFYRLQFNSSTIYKKMLMIK